MILKVTKTKNLYEDNPNADWDGLFSAFGLITDLEGKVICLYYDYGSPFAGLHSAERINRIADWLEVAPEEIDKVLKSSNPNLKEAGARIGSLQEDVTTEILKTVEEQNMKLAMQMRELKIEIGSVASEDKSFDHFMAYQKQAPDIAENISKLREKCKPDYVKEILESATTEKAELKGDVLTNRFKKQNI